MISYKPLKVTLAKRGMTQSDLRELTGICRGTMTNIWQDKSVTLDTIERICVALNCTINDVVKIIYIPEE